MDRLTQKQILISRITLAAILTLTGAVMLICAFTPLPFKRLILPAAIAYIGLSLLCLSFVQQNTLFLWLSAPALAACAVTVLSSFTPLSYGEYYPLYILSPAIGSFITMLYSKEFSTHLKVIAAFLPISGLFMLHSFFSAPLKIILPVVIIYFSVLLIAYSLIKSKETP